MQCFHHIFSQPGKSRLEIPCRQLARCPFPRPDISFPNANPGSRESRLAAPKLLFWQFKRRAGMRGKHHTELTQCNSSNKSNFHLQKRISNPDAECSFINQSTATMLSLRKRLRVYKSLTLTPQGHNLRLVSYEQGEWENNESVALNMH